jgi:hypothetical protein
LMVTGRWSRVERLWTPSPLGGVTEAKMWVV